MKGITIKPRSFSFRLRARHDPCLREGKGYPPALHMLAAALMLFLVVGIFTGRNIRQTDNYISTLLSERGRAIIEVFEGGLLNAMRLNSRMHIQEFLEDLASSEDIKFIAVVLDSGHIVAHSDPERIGRLLNVEGRPVTAEQMQAFGNMDEEMAGSRGRLLWMERSLSFVVHQPLYNPLVYMEEKLPTPPPLNRARVPVLTIVQPAQMFVGLDALPLRKMQQQNMRSALLSGSLILLASLAIILALRYFEHGMESRRRMRVAETLAQSMVEEVRRLEKEVRRSEKQAAIGDLAAGVAHELRNPLSSIKGYATYFSTRFPEGSEDRDAARIMVQEVDRLNRVISDLIGVSKPTDIHPVPTNMGELAESIIRLLSQDAGQHNVILRREGENIIARIDPDRFRQALLNICINAMEAMPQGGEIIIGLHQSQEHIAISVRDTGPGMSADLVNRIFDPYFTTKSQGTGLGLVMVQKIVDAHEGTVQVRSEEGAGTTFQIILPLVNETDSFGEQPASL